jgi:hypothetical protein
MEDILLDCFGKLESGDSEVVYHGLVDLDGFLAEICATSKKTTIGSRRSGAAPRAKHHCSQVYRKEAVHKFLRLQDNYMFNITGRIVICLQRLLKEEDAKYIREITLGFEIIQGTCLLHYPSRKVFSNQSVMQMLIDCVERTTSPPQLHVALINTIVSIMVHEVGNIRLFELLGGLGSICSLFKNKETSKEVKLRILEFLFFYLISETKSKRTVSNQYERKTTEDKQQMLSVHLSNVNGLVREMNMSKPFGDMDLEW